MDIHTTGAELVIHLALYCAAGGALVLAAFAAVERVAGAEGPAVRPVHIAAAWALTVALFAVERGYHGLLS